MSYFLKKDWEVSGTCKWSHLKGHVLKWGRKILKVDFLSIGSLTGPSKFWPFWEEVECPF